MRRVPAILLAPWRRAPLLLARRPGVALAVAGAAAILAVSAAATPLFLSSVGSAALTRQLDKGCLNDSIPYMVSGSFGTLGGGFTLDGGAVQQVEDKVRRAVAGVPHVQPTVETLIGSQLVGLAANGRQPFDEQVLSRTHFRDHIRVVEQAPVSGVYITDDAARYLGGVHAGDTVQLSLEGRTAAVPVEGIYRNLEYQPPAQYWCAEQRLIYPPGYGADFTPPMVLLADRAVFKRLGRQLHNRAVLTFELPPSSYRLTVAAARQIDDAVRTKVAPALAGSAQGEVFFGQLLNLRPNLGHLIDRATGTAKAVRAAVVPAAVAGGLVALLLVGAAGSYWADRRSDEVRLLATRGVGPAAIGVKAALEMGTPTLLGGAAGFGAAVLLVRGVGPSQVFDAPSVRAAAIAAAAAVVAGIGLLGITAAARAVRSGDAYGHRRRRWRALAVVPWELAALGAAAVTLHWLVRHGATRPGVAGIATVDVRALAFPLLFLVGAVGLAGRLAYLLLRRARGRRLAGPPAPYLAGRRLTHAPQVALVTLVASALPIGTLLYSAAVTRSVSATLHAKVSTYAGSDVAADLLSTAPVPRALAGRATEVERSDDQQLGSRVGGVGVDVLGVDPATFADGAFWTSQLGQGRSLASLLDALRPPPGGTVVPAILAGVPAGSPTNLVLSDRGAFHDTRLTVVDRLAAFPGLRGRPLVVVDRALLDRLTHDVGHALWAKGTPGEVLATLRDNGMSPLYVVDRDAVLDASSFLSLTWTFGFLSVIGGLSGLIALGGLLLHLEARTRARRTSYVLARRMGLRPLTHLGSLALELGALLGVGLLAGAGFALAAAWAVHDRLDVAPSLQPTPLMPLPTAALGGAAAAVAGIVVLGAIGAHVVAVRANPAQVLRFSG